MTRTWGTELLGQLEFYWNAHLWPRLDGLSDDEYFWEPVGGCWSLRKGETGEYEIESFSPEPPIAPVTTIAWRLAHVGLEIFGTRACALFGPTDAPDDANMYDRRHWPEPLPGTADDALTFLHKTYTAWHDGVAGLTDEDLRRPIGPKGVAYAEDSMAALVLHINREVMAHGAEICLLRDLYRAYRLAEEPLVAAGLRGDGAALARLVADDPDAVEQARSGRPQLVAEVAGLRRWSVVRLLVEHGLDVNAGSPAALHYAAAAGAVDEARYLVDHGADGAAIDALYGLPPAGWADYFSHAELAEFLRTLK